jgi:hypothetical protein
MTYDPEQLWNDAVDVLERHRAYTDPRSHGLDLTSLTNDTGESEERGLSKRKEVKGNLRPQNYGLADDTGQAA